MSRLRVLIFHPTLLPPKDYGGTERVVLWLAKGLQSLGHEVWVAARPGSRLPSGVRLLEVPKGQSGSDSASAVLPRFPAGLDVVHFMAPPEEAIWDRLPCAGLTTIHGNGKAGEVFHHNCVFLSRDHARRHGGSAFVYNGIDPEEYRFEPNAKGESFLFLSKTSWRVKNLAGAMRYCARAQARLTIAGGRRPIWARAWSALDPRFRWEGPVAGERKARLLAEARALVFPVTWSEPFGLVVAEALMSGTPVLASRRGSLPELLSDDVGALIEAGDQNAWVQALRSPRHWDPARCRAHAMERFHYKKMAESYVEYYLKVKSGQRIHDRSIQAP